MFYAPALLGAFLFLKVKNMLDYMTQLQKLPLHKLRDLGREKGVKAPTSLKKSELIVAIANIESGKTQPKFNDKNRGRPVLDSENPIADVQATIELKQIKALEKLNKLQGLLNKFEKDVMRVILEDN